MNPGLAPTPALLLFVLALLPAGCSERGRSTARPAASHVGASARCERPGRVVSVVPVHVAAGFEVRRAGEAVQVQEGLLVEVGGLDALDFAPRAMPGPSFVWGNDSADMIVHPLSGPFQDARATLLVPRPASGDEAVLWLLGWNEASMRIGRSPGEGQPQGGPPVGDCFVVTLPGPAAQPRHYASYEALKFSLVPQWLPPERCRQELGKECGVLLHTRLGPLTCGDCPAGQVCTAENQCTKASGPARP